MEIDQLSINIKYTKSSFENTWEKPRQEKSLISVFRYQESIEQVLQPFKVSVHHFSISFHRRNTMNQPSYLFHFAHKNIWQNSLILLKCVHV